MEQQTKNILTDLLANTGDMALKRRARRIIEKIDPKPKDKILDVGCGDGFYLHLLFNLKVKNLKLVGVDIDKNALKSARKNLRGKKVKFIQADLLKGLPFKSGSFDKIIMSEVCEHLENDIKGLKEVKRVLKKGGTLVITVPNHNYPFLWDPVNWMLEHLVGIHIKSGFWAGIWNQHLRLYTPEEIQKVVKKAGFKVKKVESLTWWCLPFNHNLIHFFARKLYGGDLSKEMAKAVSKYETRKQTKPWFIGLIFSIVNFADKLNDIWQPENTGVGIFVLAEK